jgi:hypothetical protein
MGTTYLDLYGGGDGDIVEGLTTGDTWLFGQDGNDVLLSLGPGNVFGGNGNDRIITEGGFSSEGLFGESGADCLQDSNAAASTIDCGDGPDVVGQSTNGVTPISINCEMVKPSC